MIIKAQPKPDVSRALLILFGEKMKAKRRQAGLTQSELAEKLGMPQQYVSLLETGQKDFRIKTASAVAEALGGEVWAMLKP